MTRHPDRHSNNTPVWRARGSQPTGNDETDRFVDEGGAKITFPSGKTPDSLDELEQFFSLFIRKAKRRAGAEKPN